MLLNTFYEILIQKGYCMLNAIVHASLDYWNILFPATALPDVCFPSFLKSTNFRINFSVNVVEQNLNVAASLLIVWFAVTLKRVYETLMLFKMILTMFVDLELFKN